MPSLSCIWQYLLRLAGISPLQVNAGAGKPMRLV